MLQRTKGVFSTINMKKLLLLVVMSIGLPIKAAKPNIVFYFIDDLGWTDVSFMGSKYYETCLLYTSDAADE